MILFIFIIIGYFYGFSASILAFGLYNSFIIYRIQNFITKSLSSDLVNIKLSDVFVIAKRLAFTKGFWYQVIVSFLKKQILDTPKKENNSSNTSNIDYSKISDISYCYKLFNFSSNIILNHKIIKTQYRKLAKQYHPDKALNDKDKETYEEIFKQVNSCNTKLIRRVDEFNKL